MEPVVPSDIVSRVQRLERQNRCMRWLLLVLPAVALAIGAGGNVGGAKGKTVVAAEFVLKDKDGRERASLRMLEDTPVLTLNDADGKYRLRLIADERGFGPSLSMFGGTKPQHTVVALRQMKDTTLLQLYRENGKLMINAGSNAMGDGMVSVMDRDGKQSETIQAKPVK